MRMNGKIATTVFTLTIASGLAFSQATSTAKPSSAQTSSQTSTKGHGNHSPDHGMNSHQGAGIMVGPDDQQFMTKAAQGGLMEIEVARIAQQKATSNEIKEFARKLEQDHSKANDQLKQIASQKNVELPTDMGKHKEQVDKLNGKSGDQFDKAFMKMQVKHHKDDIGTFEKETNLGMDSDVKSFASSTLPTLQAHLKQAQELQGSTRGRKAEAPAAAAADSSAKPAASK